MNLLKPGCRQTPDRRGSRACSRGGSHIFGVKIVTADRAFAGWTKVGSVVLERGYLTISAIRARGTLPTGACRRHPPDRIAHIVGDE